MLDLSCGALLLATVSMIPWAAGATVGYSSGLQFLLAAPVRASCIFLFSSYVTCVRSFEAAVFDSSMLSPTLQLSNINRSFHRLPCLKKMRPSEQKP